MTPTDDYQMLQEISDRQAAAIDELVRGATHAAAAERVGVHRVTVSNWASRHPGFRAELNRRRTELTLQRAARVRELDELALEKVAKHLETDDPEYALRWLKLSGGTAPNVPATGSTVPDEIFFEMFFARLKPCFGPDRDDLLSEIAAMNREEWRPLLESAGSDTRKNR